MISMWSAVIFMALLASGAIILCSRMAPTRDDATLNYAILGASVVVGWLAGMLMSPGTMEEKTQFGVAAKTISTFASGYLLAKTDGLVSALLTPKVLLESASLLPAFRLTMTIAAVVAAALHIYMVRVYMLDWVPDSNGLTGPTDPKKEHPAEER